MKLFKQAFFVALLCLTTFTVKSQGWPANYDGVILQGFFWDSYSDTKWTNLERQADELSQYFDLIWIPNSANSDGGMGYMPVFWFSNYNSAFGTEKELRNMINTFKEKGTGFIADVVVNHRNGNKSAWDFPTETYKGKTYDMAEGSIVSNDNIWDHMNDWGKGCPASYKGNSDTGDRFDGCRDLDHTNTTVQEHIKAYCDFLLNDLGYEGFRYDMVKGYAGKYTKIYNESSKPSFSVGEYWDNSYDAVANWIEATGKTSAAFDFPCKYQINSAFSNGLHLKNLTWTNPSKAPQPAGMIHYGYQQYAVTFVDNHDTYRDGNKFPDNNHILAANAFILSSPGTPCVFLRHYIDYKSAIQAMIAARKSAGITNTSSVNVLTVTDNCYMAVVEGTRGVLAVKIGSDMITPEGFNDDQIMASGNDYCIWVNSDGSYTPPIPVDPSPAENITIYYDNTNTKFNPVYCYTYANDADNGPSWPGVQMSSVEGNIFSISVPAGSNAVFNTGSNSSQTVDVLNVVNGYIYTGLASKNSEGKYDVDQGKPYHNSTPDLPGVSTLYIQGNFDEYSEDWDPTKAKEMTLTNGKFVLGNVVMNGIEGNAYFSFSDTKGSWDVVNAGTRFGAPTDGTVVSPSSESVVNSYSMTAGSENAWKVVNGTYNFEVDPSTLTFTLFTVVSENPDNDEDQPGKDEEQPGQDQDKPDNDNDQPGQDEDKPDNGNDQPGQDEDKPGMGDEQPEEGDNEDAGIEILENDSENFRYFTIQGIPVKNPSKGIYIKVTGNNREKIVIR